MGAAGERAAGWKRTRGRAARLAVVVLAAVAAGSGLAACSGRGPFPSLPLASFTAHGSIDEAYVLGATPGEQLTLVGPDGREEGQGTADSFGSLIFRSLRPRPGYQVQATESGRRVGTAPFAVLDADQTPPESLYTGQPMHQGLNYIRMRDGIELAATVRLPPGKTLADGPFPTVIEYSGYQIAAPGDLLSGILNPPTDPTAKALLPDSATAVGSIIAPLLGFATVSLQMRGTGCSGGAFDLFDLPTTYDGYDAVEIVAHQSWVAHHKVGMVGISFSGISQMFVAGSRPPDLAAVAPMSVTDDLFSTGSPGGIFNSGFAASWIAARVSDAKPAPGGGQPYATALIDQGDTQCLADQKLRLQTQDIATILTQDPYRDPSLYDPRSPRLWAAKIDVPTFLVGANQDEQTGGQWAWMIPALAHDPNVWVTMTNGAHVDSLDPAVLSRWIEFLDIFVAQEVPTQPSFASLSGLLYQKITGAASEPLPAVRFTDAASVSAARADFVAQDPRIRVLMDNGGAAAQPGALQPLWEEDFASWPPPAAVTTRFELGPSGTLVEGPVPAGSASYKPDPSLRPATDLPASGNAWAALPPYDWTPVTGDSGLGFVSPALATDTTVVGPAALDLTLASSATDTDVQVTVSEVRPDGSELYVSSGFLRASERALDARTSTALQPMPTFLAGDAQPLQPGVPVTLQIPITPFAHTFRAGSRIRVVLSAPGGDRPEWVFATPATGGAVTDTVSLGGASPSALLLAVLPGVTAPDAVPPCPSLRGEPCRSYVPAGNGG